jgi:hypothetical protein
MSVTMKKISPTVQTIYAELLQQVFSQELRSGSLYERNLKGNSYTYVKRQVGVTRRDYFIGRTDDAITKQIVANIKMVNSNAVERRKLVAMLKRAGFPNPLGNLTSVIDVLDDAGIMRQTVLIGTSAYQCYGPMLGYVLPLASITTQDADVATASLAISAEKEGETLATILLRADSSFRPVPQLDSRKPSSRFISSSGFMVDFLTPQLRRSDKNPMPLTKLDAGATPLQQLDWLINEPINAVMLFGGGLPLRIPEPAKFAIHKLIIAQKRGIDLAKRTKDLLQAKYLITALRETHPWSLHDAYQEARSFGEQGWRKPISRSLREINLTLEDLA